MNTKNAIEQLSIYLDDFQVHPRFIKELSDLLKKELKGKEQKFFTLLITQLKNIQEFGPLIHTIDSNEKLLKCNGNFYSIHLQQSQFNIRLLVHITDSDRQLLVAFYERSGKKSTNYTQYIKVLENRLNDLKTKQSPTSKGEF